MKIEDIILKLREFHEPYTINTMKSRDIVICGNSNIECTGVGVCITATIEVLKKAVENHINLIITHESIFYGSSSHSLEVSDDPVYSYKLNYIKEHNLVIYRDHDRLHGMGEPFNPIRYNPDYIFYGISKELNWDDYIVGDKLKPLQFKLPVMKGYELANYLIDKFSLKGLRILGDLNTDVSNVFFCEHIDGGERDIKRTLIAKDADAIIPFEIVDYTLTQYVHDSNALKIPKLLLEMGHFNCEQLGMKYMVNWLEDLLVNQRVLFLQCDDIFNYYAPQK